MKNVLLMIVLFAAGICAGMGTNEVRNPFWPIGHTGVYEVVSADVRVDDAKKKKNDAERVRAAEEAAREKERLARIAAEKSAAEKAALAAAAAAEKAARERIITAEHWAAARKMLRFGGMVKARAPDGRLRMCVLIGKPDGKDFFPYQDGDALVLTHDNRCFTWRVQGLSDRGVLRLERVRARLVEDHTKAVPSEKGKQKK